MQRSIRHILGEAKLTDMKYDAKFHSNLEGIDNTKYERF
jgi:hypothetical protein